MEVVSTKDGLQAKFPLHGAFDEAHADAICRELRLDPRVELACTQIDETTLNIVLRLWPPHGNRAAMAIFCGGIQSVRTKLAKLHEALCGESGVIKISPTGTIEGSA